jgi:branched-chain amino acid transport system permease protein
VFGPILILLVIFLPNGIVGLFQARQVRRTPLPAPAGTMAARRPQPTGGDGHA